MRFNILPKHLLKACFVRLATTTNYPNQNSDYHCTRNVMSSSPITSLNTLLNKAAMTFSTNIINRNDTTKNETNDSKLAPIDQVNSYNEKDTSVDEKYRFIGEKIVGFLPTSDYQRHALHYVLKGIGYLPDPLLEHLVGYLKGPTSKQYSHANAHLRLIIGANSKLKTPLQLDKMAELRKRFAADAVAMQDPKVWQQASFTKLSPFKLTKDKLAPVNWHDETIGNADDDDMTVRCYQAGVYSKKNHNTDQTVMLFLHGGGFCIGDIDTHHEFCHAVCAQTGWSVVSVDYRLAPEYSAPTAFRDVVAAYSWLADNADTLGASSSRIVLAGDSAGGGMSTLVAQQISKPTEQAWLDLGSEGQRVYQTLKTLPKPMAQMPLYPVTDIETDYPSWELYGEGLLLDHADVAIFDAAFLHNSPLPREHVLISPIHGDNSEVCPTYIVASELDVLRDQSFVYAEQLKSHSIAVETYTVLGAPHGFIHLMSVHKGLEQETGYIINDFARFVREVISAQALLAA